MKILDGVRYTKTDEWVLLDGDVATVGISDYAQSKLGDIVFVGDMTVGAVLKAGDLLVSTALLRGRSSRPMLQSPPSRSCSMRTRLVPGGWHGSRRPMPTS
jgi:hypothetical protein